MRVVEVSALLMKCEFIDEVASRLDGVLTDSRSAIHDVRDLKTVPMHRERFWQMVIDDDPDSITLIYLNGGSGSTAVEAPQVHYSAWIYLLLHRLGNEMKLFDPIVQSKLKIGYVRCLNRQMALHGTGVLHVHMSHGRVRTARILMLAK